MPCNLTAIRSLHHLEVLEVKDTVSDDDMHLGFLHGLKNLKSLNFDNTLTDDLSYLSMLTGLTELSCSKAYIGDNTGFLSCLTNLVSLRVVDTYMNDLRATSSLVNLKYLDCSRNPDISDASPLRNLTSLDRIIVRNCPLVIARVHESLPAFHWCPFTVGELRKDIID